LLDLSFQQPFFLMVMSDFLKNLRVLQLGFQDILLVTLAYAVACFCRLFHLIQKIVTFAECQAFAGCRPAGSKPS